MFDPFTQTQSWGAFAPPGFPQQFSPGPQQLQQGGYWPQFQSPHLGQSGFAQPGYPYGQFSSGPQLSPQTWNGGQFGLTPFGQYNPIAQIAAQQAPHLIMEAQRIAQHLPLLAQQIPQLIQQNPQLAQQAPQLQQLPLLLQQAAEVCQRVPQVLQAVGVSPFTGPGMTGSPYSRPFI
jgi:hypothetical protein